MILLLKFSALLEHSLGRRSTLKVKKMQRTGRLQFSDELNENEASQARKLPFKFKFKDFYTGRKQDMRDAMAMESRQVNIMK